MDTVIVKVNLLTETCCDCGIVFGMPDYHKNRLLETGGSFYCPNGHGQHYTEPEVKRLQKLLSKVEKSATLYRQWYDAEQDDHARTRRSLAATKGVLTKTKKRIANGSCPCCKRHFTNLQRHMENKHPDYSIEVEEK